MEKASSRSDLSDTDRADEPVEIVEPTSKQLEANAPPANSEPPAGTAAGPATPGPPPDGGLQAWLQVLGSAAILVNTWGLINSFGVFQAFYETDLLKDRAPSDISWIGSLQASLLFFAGVVSGGLYDAGYFRALLVVGLSMIVFGMFMTSLCYTYWQFLLAQGICVGVGMGLVFLPSAAILSQYFDRHRALVLGLSSAGSPIAGIVVPVIFSRLEPKIGFGWTTRVIAFILLAFSAIPIAFMRTRLPPSGRGMQIFDPTAFRDIPYMTFTMAGFFSFLTLYVPFFYIAVFATTYNVTTPDFAPYLVTLLNTGSVFGRIIPNALADRWGALNVLVFCMIGSTAIAFGWLGVKNLAGSIVFTLLYGALSGGVVSLTPTVIVALSPDMSRVGVRMGMGFVVTGTSLLIGTPIAGAIVKGYTDANWKGTIAYGAAGLFVATVLYATARFLVFKRQGGLKF
ncbi:major facilitator superfamily domain-containing protein [Cercophora newfieldiana]|uniref:Major facilitator superfamily domain-containing protein n=1 Tax=Cercophora newfieldiana TaxID=92897 RepID=A0AA40CZ22_9PEZI|nr:major facilitator superfamily domain-containing protein [Cercophora newfieldiana]